MIEESENNDGVVITDGKTTMVVAFEPNQIKSATENTGAFSNKEDDTRYRHGDGALTDGELSYEHDTVGKMLGGSTRTARQRREFAERERERMAERVRELAQVLHLDNVEVVTDVIRLEGKQAKAKGYFSKRTGKITIVIPNHASVEDVEKTLLHEAVAHHGLRRLFGKQFDTFLDNVFLHAEPEIRREMVSLAAQRGWDFRTATEEYLAGLAEATNFEHIPYTFWSKIKRMFLQMIHNLGFENWQGPKLGDNELRYLLWRSYENLKEPGRYRSILGEAADVAKQYELKVGHYEEAGHRHGMVVNGTEAAGSEAAEGESFWDRDMRALIRRLVTLSSTRKDKVYRLALGEISERQQKDLRRQGINIDKDWRHSIENSSIIHAQKRHSVTMEDFEKIPDILKNYDELEVSDYKNNVGNHVVIYKKKYNDGTTYYLEEVRNGRHSLAFQTMYKTKSGDSDGLLAKPTPERSETTSDISTSSAAKLGNNFGSGVKESENVVKPRAWGKRDLLSKAEQVSNGIDADLLFRDSIEDDNNTARATYDAWADSATQIGREAWQDSMINVRNLQKAVLDQRGERLEDWEDAYNEENRSHGRSRAESEYFGDNLYKPLLDAVNKAAKAAKVSVGDVVEYMMAKHGLERNRVFAERDAKVAWEAYVQKQEEAFAEYQAAHKKGRKTLEDFMEKSYEDFLAQKRERDYSGLTALTGVEDVREAEAEAERIVEDMEEMAGHRHDMAVNGTEGVNGTGAVNGTEADGSERDGSKTGEGRRGDETDVIQTLWDRTNAATKWTLRKAYESGVVSKDNYEHVRDMFAYYIPLRGWDETTAGDIYDYVGSGDNGNVFSPTLHTAKGRGSRADNPLAYIGSMAVSAIVEGNKNKVKQSFMRFVENHPTTLVTVSEMWYVNDGTAEAPKWHEDVPDIPENATADDVERIVREHEEAMKQKEEQGLATKKRGGLHLRVPVKNGEALEHHVEVLVNGKKYVLYINGNPRAAQALNATRARRASAHSVESNWIGRVNRWLGQAYTSLNVSFGARNAPRDLTMALITTAIKEDPVYAVLFRLNIARLGGPVRMFTLMRWYNNYVSEHGLTPPEGVSKIKRYFYEFITQGSETGYTSLKEIDDYKKDMEKLYGNMNRKIYNPMRLMRGLAGGLEYANRCIEDMTRFATYMASRQRGRSIRQSTSDAKNITLNFNRKGSGELGNATYRNLQIFVNPSIQSLQNVASIAKQHPVKFTLYTGLVSLVGFAMPLATQLLWSVFGSDGDDDGWNAVDEYWKLPSWQRRNNLVIWIPGTRKFAMIALAQEYRVFHGFGETAMSVLSGHDGGRPWLELASQALDLLPLDVMGNGGNPLVNFAPTVFQPLLQTGFNSDFTGRPLYKDTEYNPQIRNCCDKMPVWLIPIILLALAVMMVSYFS